MLFRSINNYIIPIIFTPIIIAFATAKRALTPDGIAAAIALDLAVSVAFGNAGFVVLCSFFVGAVIVDKIKKHTKKQTKVDIYEDKDCRNYIQVIANGFVSFASAIAFIITGEPVLIIPFVTSLAEAFSDTVASGIGAFATTVYDPFRRRRCEGGMSGGMSVEGTLASLVGAVLISSLAYLFGFEGFGVTELFVVAGCAFLGSIIDSALGSLAQVKFKCPVCGALTEREEHCDTPTLKHSGYLPIDNDIVNMISCASSAIIATAIVLII